MSSNIPARRTTRAGRNTTTATAKDSENANARPLRMTSQAKASTTATASRITTRGPDAKSANATSTAAQPKRKREALGELTRQVTNNDKTKVAGAVGKGKAKEGVVLKAKTTTSTTTTVRAPLRPVTRRPKAASAAVKDEPRDEDAMVVDVPAAPVPAARRISRPSTTSYLSRRSSIPVPKVEVEDEAEVNRAYKKRRTSSDAPEEDDVRQLLEDDDVENDAPEVVIPEPVQEVQQWDDLDAEDADDPVMVSEYVEEIFDYLKKIEFTTMANPNYMESQKELAWKMRGILMDWLIQLHKKFRLMPETLFLAVNLVDRVLSARVVSLARLQLLGVTCLFIAAKVEEVVAPGVSNYVYCADSSYTEAKIIEAEEYVLKTIDWNLSYPNPMHFLRRVSKADNYEANARTLSKYFLEVACVEWRLIAAPPSLLAAAAMFLGRLMLGNEIWTANLEHYSSYPEHALVPTANLMLNYVLKPMRHESLYKKYATKKYNKVSLYARDWATSRWAEGTSVALAHELPEIKASIKAEREKQELALALAEAEAEVLAEAEALAVAVQDEA